MNAAFKTSVCSLVVALALPFIAAADVPSQIQISPDGTFTASGITVYQKAGNNFFSRATWGQAFVRVTVLTNGSTTVLKSHGEQGRISDISEKDPLDVTGTINFSSDGLTVLASQIRDNQLLLAPKTLSGTVKSVGTNSFVLTNKTFGSTTVTLSPGGQITKGVRTIYISDLVVGDTVLSTEGTYDYNTSTLTASSVTVYQDKAMFVGKNFDGKLKSVAGTQLPTTVVITVGSTDYTVFLPANASILKNNKAATTLSRFVVGDSVRFYGSIRQTNFTQVDTSILRDLNF